MQNPFARFSLFLVAAVLPVLSQQQPPPPPRSPEVHPDRSVTFRFRAPNIKAVVLSREGQSLPMQKDEQGVWTVTTGPLEPDFYGYTFVADGVALTDPSNPLRKPNLLNTQSVVHVPGAALPWEISDVPRRRRRPELTRALRAVRECAGGLIRCEPVGS